MTLADTLIRERYGDLSKLARESEEQAWLRRTIIRSRNLDAATILRALNDDMHRDEHLATLEAALRGAA